MNFVFSNWLMRQHSFYGTYERKVSIMALCRIFEHGINTQDPRLVSVMINDLIEVPSVSNKVRTRSQGPTQTQVISIPIMLKIFKLLVNELTNLREVKTAMNNTVNETDEDDDDEDNGNNNDPFDEPKNFSALMLYDDGN